MLTSLRGHAKFDETWPLKAVAMAPREILFSIPQSAINFDHPL
jgi:hypothetical protein